MKLLGFLLFLIGIFLTWYGYPRDLMFIGLVVAGIGAVIFAITAMLSRSSQLRETSIYPGDSDDPGDDPDESYG